MKAKIFLVSALMLLALAQPAQARRLLSPNGLGASGEWLGSGGVGLTVSPTMFLLSPQMEYVAKPWLLYGALVQLGLGNGVLFGASATARILMGHHPYLKPSVETGLGFAIGSSRFDSSAGVLIHLGVGFDYLVDKDLALGTMLRASFAPPLKTFFLSWPMIVARLVL